MAHSSDPHTTLTPVRIPIDGQLLHGDLGLPAAPQGVVVFAHGSGSSRHSPRNQFVARHLRDQGLGTLLIDLLTPKEEAVDERTREFRFNLALLGQRLIVITDWLSAQRGSGPLPIGLFGASTGAGAALIAAAARPAEITAIVSRGGRPDLAGDALPLVHAPTLLIVGGDDEAVIGLNRQAMALMRGSVRLEIVPGATHLFEEAGKLEQVAELAASWFVAVFRAPGGGGNGGRHTIASP
jgi:putative phosphoribosyl transferase